MSMATARLMSPSRNDTEVFLGNGDGTLASPRVTRTSRFPQDHLVVDIDGDRVLDLVTVDSGGHTVTLLHGNGDGTFGAAVAYDAGVNPTSLVALDLDRNGKLDLLVAGTDGVSVLMQTCVR